VQFIDEARLLVQGGRGGDGCVSFNREKYRPRGGPDGGRGGDGGSVIVVATEDLSTLEPYAYRHEVKAGRGRHGQGSNRAGERGEDVILEVPVGTLVYSDGELVADLEKPGDRVTVARGGAGGRGNESFATSTRQAPAFAEKGLPGERREIRLELRVLSDVGLVGLPNAGKSSLLAALSAARPKVGDYPFTTLTPRLGVVDRRAYREPFVVADIPGLIEGASEGRGLGNRFLRHVARSRLLVLLLDASGDPEGAEAVLRAELGAAGLAGKPAIVVLNKVDLLDEELREYLGQVFPDSPQISAATGEGVEELADLLKERLEELESVSGGDRKTHRTFRPTWKGVRVEAVNGGYRVSGELAERLVLKTDWENPEAVEHFQRELRNRGILAALRRAGAQPGDEVQIGDRVFDLR
jgi:GTP-binding protein